MLQWASSASKVRFDLSHVALVKASELGQQLLAMACVLIGSEHSAGKACALHLQKLINQNVTARSDVPFEAATLSQNHRLRESPSICEFWKVKLNAVHALQVKA